MSHLQLTPEGQPLEDAHLIPIDDPDEPMTETDLRELELDRAADEGMIEPPGPEMAMTATEVPGPGMEVPGPRIEPPGPEDEPRWPEVEVPGTEVPGPEQEPADPAVEAPGRGDRPPIVSAGSPAGVSQTVWRPA
jgi:hypothetical protein